MRWPFGLLLLLPYAVIASAAASSPVQLHRFPVLGSMTDAKGNCRTSPASRELLAQGVVRMISLRSVGEPERELIVSTDSSGRVRVVTAFYSIAVGKSRREGESIYAFYSANGNLDFGTRRYITTGIPARRSEDRSAELTAAEADSAVVLARGVLRRCAR